MSDEATSVHRDYRNTIFLPSTPFPMRGGLPELEPQLLNRSNGLYEKLRSARQQSSAPLFVLHDGPPYANGPIHIGHALNKLLKDFIVRSRFALGFDVDYVPGWDCHGLPIEWKIEEEFRLSGRSKNQVSKAEFRARCREYAAVWIDEQSREFQRLWVLGNWQDRYATMDFTAEAAIVAEFHKFLELGQVYRGSKPVMWSPVERTALADAEVEYHPHVSPTVWVRFAVDVGPKIAEGASVVIWTTTPWTLPANRAVAFNPEISYAIFQVDALDEGLAFEPWAKVGERLILAVQLAEQVFGAAQVSAWTRLDAINPEGLVCRHPLAALDEGYRFAVPLLSGDHVTDQTGTGFVHTAPGHGADDYAVWLAHGYKDIPEIVDEDGAYFGHVPLFGNLKILETEGKKAGKFGPANEAVTQRLIECGSLLARGRLEHSYPHSWRSKAPVIFRNTPQWFIGLDKPLAGAKFEGLTLRQLALRAIDRTQFFPQGGRNRIRAMVEGRPDWLISRQRAWGSPIAMFVDKYTGEPLCDPAVNHRIIQIISAEGADAWFSRDGGDFLGDHDPARYEKVEDILDVWFDSGSSHAFALEHRNDSRSPADLYLEGSDQHRGWFQSSLLESCATRGHAPFLAVLTHGFTLDERGEKMSKSVGNSVDPQVIIQKNGAEILRLWVSLADCYEDQRIGPAIIQSTTESYRKIRNTIRYLLGSLAGFNEEERIDHENMPPLEKFILHRLWVLSQSVRENYEKYRFTDVIRSLSDFCSNELSSLFFDIRRDALYCDRPDSTRRRACRTVMNLVFERLTIWLSPILPFTMEEAWSTRFPGADPNSLREFPATPESWRDDLTADRWRKVEQVTRVVTGALEIERREKRMGSALEARPVVHIQNPVWLSAFDDLDPAEVFRTSQASLVLGEGPPAAFRLDTVEGVSVEPQRAEGRKCARSWRILPEVGTDPRYPDLSIRDADAVAWWDLVHG